MNCPKCGFAMNEFDTECPRCKRLPAAAPPQSAPLPAVEPVSLKAPRKGKQVLPVAAVPRSNKLTGVLVGVGVLVVILLAALLWTQLHKPSNAGGVGAGAGQSQAAAGTRAGGVGAGAQGNQLASTTNAGGVGAGPGESANGLTTNGGGVGAGQGQNANGATTNSGGVGSGQQQAANAMTTNAGGVGEGEDEAAWSSNQVASWGVVYDKTGSGQFTTPALPVHRPWSIEYYSGVEPNDAQGFLPVIFTVFVGTGSLETPTINVSQSRYHDTQPCFKRGPTPLQIVTYQNNWHIIVYQGTFKPG